MRKHYWGRTVIMVMPLLIVFVMGGCTTTENIRFTVTGISTKAIEYCPDLQRIEEKELSEVELLLVIKGWIERYEECKGRHKVLSDALQEIIHESK